MASALSIDPSAENSYFLKWVLLLVDGGTLVLREHFNRVHPPQSLACNLSQKSGQLKVLEKKGMITTAQYNLLYPQQGSPDSNTFDITLLTCLLRYVCGLNTKSSAWTSTPAPTDLTTEADIARLRAFRNETAHSAEASMTEQAFKTKWASIEQVLLRLGTGIPGLQVKIDAIRGQSIDPTREKELQNMIETWENMDKLLQKDVEEIKSALQSQENEVQELYCRVDTIDEDVVSLKDNDRKCRDETENINARMQSMEATVPVVQKQFNKFIRSSTQQKRNFSKLRDRVSTNDRQNRRSIKSTRKTLLTEILRVSKLNQIKKKMSPEMEALVSNTRLFLEDVLDCPYIETQFHQRAMKTIEEHKILVISGHPGEGKTTMAARIMSEITSQDRCLKLREPSDWKIFDVGLGHFDVLFADDMFGPGSMDDRIVKEWGKFLPDIYRATQKRGVKVIFTSRKSILDDAKELLHSPSIFDDKNIVLLSSENLSDSEKHDMLEIHLKEADRSFQNDLIDDCIFASGFCFRTEILHGTSGVKFGFPQCVTMFAKNEILFQRKENFFSRPTAFFRQYIEELFKDENKFLALILIWSRPKKRINISELDVSSTSHELKRIAKKFELTLKPKLVKIVKKSLNMHKGGLVVFNQTTGEYSFSHHTIGDMIGLVVGNNHPKAVLELSSRDFVVNYVTVDKERQDMDNFLVQPYLFKDLGAKMLSLFLEPNMEFSGSALKRFQRTGNCSNTVTPAFHIDGGLIYVDALKNETFISDFVSVLEEQRYRESASKLLSLPVMNMSGHFLGRGIYIEDTVITLPDFLLLHGQSLLLEKLIKGGANLMLFAEKLDIDLSLMIATHARKNSFVQFLLNHTDIVVTEEVIYLAAMTRDCDLLNMLLGKRRPNTEEQSRIFNGNNALTASAKKGLTLSVQCLVESGEDVTFKNSDNCDALGKAVIYKHLDICEILIKAGSPLNDRIGKFKRTPLHIACDVGDPDIVRLLLENGASPCIKDKKGHFPIHCAGFRDPVNVDVVEVLLTHDLNLAKQRITSFRKQSKVKGMTIYHIAVMKKHAHLIDKLIGMKADPNVTDVFGRTPLVYAMSEGFEHMSLIRTADINKAEKQGLTPLHVALQRGNSLSAAQLLQRADIDVNSRDNLGRTPLYIAFQRDMIETGIDMLLKHNADMRMITNKGSSIFHVLCKKLHKSFHINGIEDVLKEFFPDINLKDGEIECFTLVGMLKVHDPWHKHYTQDLNFLEYIK